VVPVYKVLSECSEQIQSLITAHQLRIADMLTSEFVVVAALNPAKLEDIRELEEAK
jgi:hypothetical protein